MRPWQGEPVFDPHTETRSEKHERQMQRMAWRDRQPGEQRPYWMEDDEQWENVRPKADEDQDVALRLLKAHRHFESLRGDLRSFEATVTAYEVADFNRRQKVENRKRRRTKSIENLLAHEEPSVPSESERLAIIEAVDLLMAKLSPRDRHLVALAHLENVPTDEIASRTGLTPRSVRNRLCRALGVLKKRNPTDF